MKPERYNSGLELRAEGRTLIGPAVTYGEQSPSHRERFEPGAFNLDDGVTRYLNLEHDRAIVIAHTEGGGLELVDGAEALEVRATLPRIPAADGALDAVRSGTLKGFSIEFTALEERQDNDVRVLSKAALAGVGLVRQPSYLGSLAEVRARSGIMMASHIQADTPADCECSGAGCKFAEFAAAALQEMVDEALAHVAAGTAQAALAELRRRDIVAVYGSYSNPLASLSKGTLRLRMDGDRLAIEIDLPDSDAGRAVMSANEDAGVVVRPYLDADRSIGEVVPVGDGNNKMVYSKAAARAFIVSATDKRQGWPVPTIIDTRAAKTRRRTWL